MALFEQIKSHYDKSIGYRDKKDTLTGVQTKYIKISKCKQRLPSYIIGLIVNILHLVFLLFYRQGLFIIAEDEGYSYVICVARCVFADAPDEVRVLATLLDDLQYRHCIVIAYIINR